MERLDKILVSQGIGSRREVQKLIKKKAVVVDGAVIVKPEFKIDPENCEIKVNGQALDFKKHIYIMMNKPAGVLSATEDSSQKTVLDLLPDELATTESSRTSSFLRKTIYIKDTTLSLTATLARI